MHIEMVCVEDALMNIGFRKMAAYARHLNAETTVRYIITFWRKHFIPKFTWAPRDRLTSANQA